MQVTETLSQGLKREYAIVVPASDLASRLDAQLADLKTKVRINGFRPGKVPVAHLKRVYGRSVMADLVQETITEANKQIVDEHGLQARARAAGRAAQRQGRDRGGARGARRPRLQGRAGSAAEVRGRRIHRHRASSVRSPRSRRARSRTGCSASLRIARVYADRPEGGKAERFDRVTVDFVGTIDGEAFEGGSSEDIEVVIGSNAFIPGFEEQLLGVAAGEKRDVEATFPEAYAARKLAGRKAKFDVTVKAVAAPEPLAIDDEFAKSYGADDLAQLQRRIRERIAAEYARASREKVKRKLLDALAGALHVRSAGRAGRAGVRLDLGAGRARAAGFRPQLRRRKHHRGGRARRISRRSPSGACASACCWPRSAPRSASRSATRR